MVAAPQVPRRRLQPEGTRSDRLLLPHSTSCFHNLNSYVNASEITLPYLNALGMVLNGAHRVSSWHTASRIPMPRLRWGVTGGDFIPSTPCERRKR